MNIAEDNLEKLNKHKIYPPHPSYIAGFIDGDGCIFIRQIKDGYQSGITITQCRTNILQIIRYHFGGNITSSTNRNDKIADIMDKSNEYYDKHNIRNQYNLLIRSNEYQILLEYLHNSFIVKEQKYQLLYHFSKLTNLPNKKEEKSELFSKCKENCNINPINFTRLNIEYIAGLFDAEGCIYINKNNFNKFYMSIAQKSYPVLLEEIKRFLTFGNLSENKFIIYNKLDCLKFIELMKPFVIVKYNQVVAMETFLKTNDSDIKTQMYKICNEEKHAIEMFNNLNKNDNGKEGYFEKIKIKNLKEKLCKQIHHIEVYKEKSKKMSGEGNHNNGKSFSEETKKKMSTSIREAKGGVSDEVIIKVRDLISQNYKNIDIQKELDLPRHTVTRIKNGDLVCRNEEQKENTKMTQEEVNISKRKITVDEIFIVIEKFNKGYKPMEVLDFLILKRSQQNIQNELTIHIVKGIKTKLVNCKPILYPQELSPGEYKYYTELVEEYQQKYNK
jgi:hypothetical protein